MMRAQQGTCRQRQEVVSVWTERVKCVMPAKDSSVEEEAGLRHLPTSGYPRFSEAFAGGGRGGCRGELVSLLIPVAS